MIGVGLDPVELIAPVDHVVGRIEGSGPGFSLEEIAETRERMLAAVRGEAADVIAAACEALPGAIITVDAGAHMLPATLLAARPRRFLISNGLASMGFAVPAALAAALERPGEPVLAFCGDGGMAYHAAELETAARLGAKLIVVVLNDSSLSLIRIKQEARGYTRSPLSFGPTDFAALAEAYGVRGVHARHAGRGAGRRPRRRSRHGDRRPHQRRRVRRRPHSDPGPVEHADARPRA